MTDEDAPALSTRIFPVQRVDGAYRACKIGHLIAEWDNVLLVRYGDVETVEVAASDKVRHLI